MDRSLQAVIFPHASLAEEKLKKVLSLMESVILFQPWFMDGAAFLAKYAPSMVKVLNPPEGMKPGGDFRNLLAEYRQWIRVNDDRGFPAFWAYARDRLEDLPIYEIRGMIRNLGRPSEEDERSRALRWHLTLHLAKELEEEQESTASLLRAAGALDSPLKGAIEDEDIPGWLSDVPDVEGEGVFTEERLAMVLNAWFSLYGEQIPGRGPLVTLKPQVMQYLQETWEEFVLEGRESGLPGFTFLFPDLSNVEMEDLSRRREAALNNTDLRHAITGFCHDPGKGFPHLKSSAGELNRVNGDLQWTFLFLPPHGEKKLPRKYRFVESLSGKVIALVQDAVSHGR